jgi:hypothetical protein
VNTKDTVCSIGFANQPTANQICATATPDARFGPG